MEHDSIMLSGAAMHNRCSNAQLVWEGAAVGAGVSRASVWKRGTDQ